MTSASCQEQTFLEDLAPARADANYCTQIWALLGLSNQSGERTLHAVVTKKQAPGTVRIGSRLSPSGLAQTFEEMGVVLRPMPGYALSDIHFERAWCDRDGLYPEGWR